MIVREGRREKKEERGEGGGGWCLEYGILNLFTCRMTEISVKVS